MGGGKREGFRRQGATEENQLSTTLVAKQEDVQLYFKEKRIWLRFRVIFMSAIKGSEARRVATNVPLRSKHDFGLSFMRLIS